jgi:hypothetical protein
MRLIKVLNQPFVFKSHFSVWSRINFAFFHNINYFILNKLKDMSIFDVPNVVLAKDPGAKLNNTGKFDKTSLFLYDPKVPLFSIHQNRFSTYPFHLITFNQSCIIAVKIGRLQIDYD